MKIKKKIEKVEKFAKNDGLSIWKKLERTQEAAEQSAGRLCREGLERPQRAAERHNSAGGRTAAPPAESGGRQTERRGRVRSGTWQERREQGRCFALLEEAGKGALEAAQDVAKLGAEDCAGEERGGHRGQAGRHNRAEEGQQHLQRRAGAGRRSAGRGADQRQGGNARDAGGVLCCCWRSEKERAA